MSVIPSVFLLILAMVIQSLWQFAPANFLLFRHYVFGKNSSKKAQDLCSFFIVGVEIVVAIIFIVVIWVMQQIREKSFFDENWCLGILAGILLLESVLMLFYFKKSGTKLNFIISTKQNLREKYQNINTKSAALKSGMSAASGEILLSLPLELLVAHEICQLYFDNEMVLAITFALMYITATIWPIYQIKFDFKHGKNLADIQRKRVKHKLLIKTIGSGCFIMVAIVMIVFRMING